MAALGVSLCVNVCAQMPLPTAQADRTQVLPALQWTLLGPAAVSSENFGLVTGRITALALDPGDPTGNRLYVGTTGGGVWVAQDAATSDPANVVFTPLTDSPGVFDTSANVSISIGALTVQPGATGVVLAGTGDSNNALDSYYGAGILRSTDGGNTWSLIKTTSDLEQGLAPINASFTGEAFAGFAWSTATPNLVVAAVTQAFEGVLVNAGHAQSSYAGLYYSTDSGATWHLARISDSAAQVLQGPGDAFVSPDGNAVTAVVWNPVRQVFIAAVRLHGYYQSSDGATWTRIDAQPGTGLTLDNCPTNPGYTGALTCPLWRAALAVDPFTGDTFAWTVDANLKDQGLWQDVCALKDGTCSNASFAFNTHLNTAPLETLAADGSALIPNGDYDLALAAIPSNGDTLLLAGAHDLWKCSLSAGCVWHNTTHATGCRSARVGAYQHAVEWSVTNPQELFIGNDSGLWRSSDAIAEEGADCAASDSTHFQNLNGGLGPLAEVESLPALSSGALLAGMAGIGAAGPQASETSGNWPQMLAADGAVVAIDPADGGNWYVNAGPGVSIHKCAQAAACTPQSFGPPILTNADVANDGDQMAEPAPFLVDPADPSQLLVATCRVWRGPVTGGWTGAQTISPILGGPAGGTSCKGAAVIRSMAALALPGGGEVVYVGISGALNGGGNLPGHILKSTTDAGGVWSAWQDLTDNPVSNDATAFNANSADVSSLFVDAHDRTGQTIYATIRLAQDQAVETRLAYRSTDGGAHWVMIGSNLPKAPANAIAIDPIDPETAYVGSDAGVYATQHVSLCGDLQFDCWAPLGAGLPMSPVRALSTSPPSADAGVLLAGTYGRGIWQIPLLTSGMQLTSAAVSPTSLTFDAQHDSPQSIHVTNTGAAPLVVTAVSVSADFSETSDCLTAPIAAGASCSVQVAFAPAGAGNRIGQLTVEGNLSGGLLTVPLSGTGDAAAPVSLAPAAIDFGNVELGKTSDPLQITAQNRTGASVRIASLTVTGPFALATNACGTAALVAGTDCQMTVQFAPLAAGPATGVLTMVDDAGTQTVRLAGTGTSLPTDTLSPASLSFGATIVGETSAPQTVSLTNSGENPLTSISAAATGPFQVQTNCGTQLAGQSSCALNVSFLPTAAGPATGVLTVADILRTQTVPLSGSGVLAPIISVAPASLKFPLQTVGTTSAPAVLTIANTGGAAMANPGFAVTGPSARSFAAGATTCGPVLVPGASCSMQVTFTPVASGVAAATLTIASSTLGAKPVSVPLTGTGQGPPGLTAAPPTLTFAAEALGRTSPPQIVTISNTSDSTASHLSFAVVGQFAIVQNSCPSSLAPGASCTVPVVFTPMQAGPLAGSLTVSAPPLTPVTVAIDGTGSLSGALRMQPASLTFPVTGVGTASAAVSVELTNTNSSVALANLALTATAGFQITASTCGTELAAGATCSVSVAFAPSGTGPQSGNLRIASNTLAADAVVPLAGTGYDFTATVSGASTQNVVRGQTAAFTVSLVPAGSGGTFTFACNALPASAVCLFDPPTNSVAAGATGTQIVQIATSPPTTAATRNTSPFPLIIWGILLVPPARRRRSLWWWLLVLLFLLALVGLITGCTSSGGGGTGSANGGNTTPAGTYKVPVVITSNGVQHTLEFTVNVE